MAAQASIKMQADDLRDELNALSQWEDEINRKDAAIKAKTVLAADFPPIRGTPKTTPSAPKPPRVDPVIDAKEKGNEFFKQGKWEDAISSYTKGIDMDPKSASTHVLYSNRAMCFIKLQKWALAEADASMCIDLNKTFPKGFFRRAVARKALGKLQEARRDLEIVLVLCPGDVEAETEIQSVTKLIKSQTTVTADQSAASSGGAPTKRKIVIQEVEDEDEEAPNAAEAEEHARRSKSHVEAAKLAKEEMEQQQRARAAQEERARQSQRRTNPRVEEVEDEPSQPQSQQSSPSPPTSRRQVSADSLKTPASFNEFERTLNLVRDDDVLLSRFVALLPTAGQDMKKLLGSALSPEQLVDILRGISKLDPPTAAGVFRSLSQVPRLTEVSMFFEKEEKKVAASALAAAQSVLNASERAKIGEMLSM